ncbi:MAG TPA: GMC family oxidoreductase [Candidatus Acidoferrales bacterium]|nr:GMC family oxidoreductase [Candidatus Acidoferrales bacterium]
MSRVAIVGSGMMGSNLALDLARLGHDVTVFEKGPEYPYPHLPVFLAETKYHYDDPRWGIGHDLRRYAMTGQYARDLSDEAVMHVGGAGTRWTGLTMRMRPHDLHTRTAFGYGEDWPLEYAELEPWYCEAEARMGVSGTDDDNPWAPPRSKPYPLPPFELTWDDRRLAGKLERGGIHIHTTPQARASRDYDGRPACQNFDACDVCPIGARYSPTVHLQRAVATGHCTLHCGVSVRRIVTDASGRARGLVARANGESHDVEHDADLVVVAAASFESARLLLLSRDARHPDGLGNHAGHVGKHLVFHHIWSGHMHYREKLWPGRLGPWTGQSEQFCNPPGRGRYGGLKIEFPSSPSPEHMDVAAGASSLEESMAAFEVSRRCRRVAMHAESVPGEGKFVRLGAGEDRFGDPRLEIHYDLDDFDHRTYEYSADVFKRFAAASEAEFSQYREFVDFGTFAHFMGTCRMSAKPADGVVDPYGQVHGVPGLYVVGLSNFVGSGGALNPTLTGLALSLRSVGRMHEELRG